MTLTATKLPDGKMYLQAENPFSNHRGSRESYSKAYMDFARTHPPILALFKCTEGQRFEDGEVEIIWQRNAIVGDVQQWITETDLESALSEIEGYETRQVYTLKSDKGREKLTKGAEDWLNKNCEKTDWNNLEEGLSDTIWTNNVIKYMKGFASEVAKEVKSEMMYLIGEGYTTTQIKEMVDTDKFIK